MDKFRFDLPHDLEEAVRAGKKTIDVRVNIQPFADVKKGDIISYKNTEVVVKSIRGYAGLGDLVAYEDHTRIIPRAKDKSEALRSLVEEMLERKPAHGVLAIEFEPPAQN
jgi:ASC-1-like (ASCH) protein